jgi:hypothetical protein
MAVSVRGRASHRQDYRFRRGHGVGVEFSVADARWAAVDPVTPEPRRSCAPASYASPGPPARPDL